MYKQTIEQKFNFLKIFIETKGNPLVEDFLNNGLSMENFLRYSQRNINHEKLKQGLKNDLMKNLKINPNVNIQKKLDYLLKE